MDKINNKNMIETFELTILERFNDLDMMQIKLIRFGNPKSLTTNKSSFPMRDLEIALDFF